MSEGLESIRKELQRLQQEGVERIFADEATLRLLQTSENSVEAPAVESVSNTSSQPKKSIDQQETHKKPRVNSPAKKQAARAEIKAIPKTPAQFKLPAGDKTKRMDWLRERVENCEVCREHLSGNGKIVFGAGSVDAEIFFCGEAPGADEAVQGEPFVGKAGQLLSKIIQAAGLEREMVYIANILKWRPEHDKAFGNRPPTIEEMNFCLPYLQAQIDIVSPKVIVALGNTAVSGLLGPDPNRKLGSVRGKWHAFNDIPMMITFHPSYLLRNGTLQTKRTVWEDMLQVMKKVELPISEKQKSFFLPKKK